MRKQGERQAERCAQGGHLTLGTDRCLACGKSVAEMQKKAKPHRVSKAQALVESGLADNLADARAQLRDMGEGS